MSDIFEELRAALWSVWHRRWLAIAIAWGVCLAGWLVIAMIPNSYESKARVYVDVEDVLSKQLGIAGDGKEEIMRVRQTLSSAKNLEKVITATRLGEGITGRGALDGAVSELEKNVKVSSEQDNLFEITAAIGRSELSEAENAVLARDVVQKLLDILREEHVAGNRAGISQAIADLERQLEGRKRELEQAEQRRLAFEAEYPDLAVGSASLSSKVQQARADLRAVDADLAAAESALAAISGQLANTPRTIIGGREATGPRAALMQAQTQLAELRARGLTDSHPDVVSTTRQVQLLSKQAAAAGEDAGGTPNPAFSSLLAIRTDRQATVEALQARRAALQSDFAGLMASQASEPQVAAEANRISRDYDVLRENYEKLLQDREALRTRGQVEDKASQFRFDVIQEPTVPQNPAAPNRPLLLLGVLIVGFGAGAAVAWALGQLKSSFATPQKLERAFDLPVIGAISLTISDAARAVEKKRLKQFAGACAGLVGMFVILVAIEIVSIGAIA
ncbi:XrtA system polysaccharide chain length determinant [Erythrobacter sanguineus]|uniref:Polysaccharide chain length determinant protein, PEP-CTERM locus subfamily n=1 Tax=Erythrobacter sanguineus TaxID=198312 RepID=A0A1M7S548_9SPHN|nr:XrtA system polysaccharide chain length determinant [Erythrobacter sanguineus]SHN53571.1 polysaccharide chain length determinant protein, PEP-CTERM locus subfamily [Erythrobacter sanguineus]